MEFSHYATMPQQVTNNSFDTRTVMTTNRDMDKSLEVSPVVQGCHQEVDTSFDKILKNNKCLKTDVKSTDQTNAKTYYFISCDFMTKLHTLFLL